MVCPRCGATIKASMKKCAKCGLPLSYQDKVAGDDKLPLKTLLLRSLLVLGAFLLTVITAVAIEEPLRIRAENKRITREYVNQVVETITLENGYKGHAFTFFGKDGDCVYIDELGQSFMFVGGIARVEVPDYVWFDEDPTDTENSTITFSPIYVSSTGKKTRIPVFSIKVDVPEAPVTITQPASERVTVITSQTGLSMNVVYGSQVIINGEDVSSKVDRSGNLNLTLNIQPIGDNNISIIVRTPNHREARRDLVFYREEMEINLEVASSVQYISRLNYMTISGMSEPGAAITVDSDYERDSLKVDSATGKFSFRAKFSAYGKNLVIFRASMEGKKDSTVSFYVDYLPAKAEYTRNAWQMDYAQLTRYYEQWHGRVFLCMGRIVNNYMDGGVMYSIMNVGNDSDVKLVALVNESNAGQFLVGQEYALYADVEGRLFYKSSYIPLLTARYTKD